MDSRECVRVALAGKSPDRVPCALGFFAQSLFGAKDADESFQTDVRFVEFAPPPGQNRFLQYLESLPPGVHMGSLSQLQTYHEWGYRPERAPSHAAPSLRAVADHVVRLLPRMTATRRYAHLGRQVERLHAQDVAVAGSPPHLGGQLFEAAWRMRGFPLFLQDLVKHPDLVDYLLDQLAALASESAQLLARAGVDILLLDDDVAAGKGLLMSPTMWRRFFKPRLARIIEAGRRCASDLIVFYHSDGDFTALLPDLVEIGVNVINPVAPDCMDAVAIRKEFGNRLAMWGTVGTAWTWDRGTPAQLRDEVRHRIENLGRGGLLLSPAYDLDFAPRANVEAFVQAVRDFG